jgi:hypothetical protein
LKSLSENNGQRNLPNKLEKRPHRDYESAFGSSLALKSSGDVFLKIMLFF